MEQILMSKILSLANEISLVYSKNFRLKMFYFAILLKNATITEYLSIIQTTNRAAVGTYYFRYLTFNVLISVLQHNTSKLYSGGSPCKTKQP